MPQRVTTAQRSSLKSTAAQTVAPRSLVIEILAGLEFAIWSFRLQANGMSRLKSAWRPINRLPSRRPFAPVTVVRRCVEPQPGNDCERVTFARVDCDPFAGATFTKTAKLR